VIIPVVVIIITYLGSSFQADTAQEQEISQFIESQNLLFSINNIRDLAYYKDESNLLILQNPKYGLNPELDTLYEEIGVLHDPQNTIVIFPTFTSSAYSVSGFYSYYKGECDIKCLTVPLNTVLKAEASGSAAQILRLLGYEFIGDKDVTKNPEILKQYDKVILLHNEYVTQEEFDAITNHPKVIYLYPNALYGKVQLNEEENTITLIRGHGYPESSIANGFDWEYDNTHPYEFDIACLEWMFYEIDNGFMLNCYPENIIISDKYLLKSIKEL